MLEERSKDLRAKADRLEIEVNDKEICNTQLKSKLLELTTLVEQL